MLILKYKPTYKPFGNRAILMEWEAIIDEDILKDIVDFKERIVADKSIEIEDGIIAYNSLTIKYKNQINSLSLEIDKLKSSYENLIVKKRTSNYIWTIPVCYDEQFGIDLQEASKKIHLSKEEIIKQHFSAIYTVYFIGFLPGFLYLGGLNKQLSVERKATPRFLVEKGSIAIAGSQTGIYPCDSAGGWNVIGKTPIPFFDIEKENPCFAKSGDKIRFKAVSMDTYFEIAQEVAEKKYVLKRQLDD